MGKISDSYKQKVLNLVNMAVFSAMLLAILNTMLFDENDFRSIVGQLRGAQTREMPAYSLKGRLLQTRLLQTEEQEAEAGAAFDEAAITDTCLKKENNTDKCFATMEEGCCHCDNGMGGCTCEAHYQKHGKKRFWSSCDDTQDERGRPQCKCVQKLQSVKAAVKAAVDAIAGASTGTKIGYQIFGALFYYFMFVKKGPKERGERKQYVANAWVPPDMLGPLNDGSFKTGVCDCCSECGGSIASMLLFTPRMATTWWAMGLVKAGTPGQAWIFSLLQVVFCFPIFPIIGLYRRGKMRDMFHMEADFMSDCFCWCCCFPLIICQEARLVDMAHGLKQGLCAMSAYFPPACGPCNIIINESKRMEAKGASWNINHLGADCKGKLLVDAANLFGKDDFSIDCTGSIILVSRGDVSFTSKVNKAAAAGAKGVLIFSNEATEAKPLLMIPNDPGSPAPKIPAAYISEKTGKSLIAMLDGGLITVEIQCGIDVVNDVAQVELQKAVDENGKIKKKCFGGFVKEGSQLVPGGTMIGETVAELVEDLKKHEKFPMTAIIAAADSKGDVPKQEEL